MGWKMRLKRIYRVLVIDTDKNTRQGLVEYYFKNLEHQYAPNARSVVHKAKDTSDALRKCSNLQLVVFSQDFPEAEKARLREWLSNFTTKILFITVPLRLSEKVT
jgi:hypothetical protein